MKAEVGGSTKRSTATCSAVTTTNSTGSRSRMRSQRRRVGGRLEEAGAAMAAVSRDERARRCSRLCREASAAALGNPRHRPHSVPMDTHTPSPESHDGDRRGRFLLPAAGIRGVYVRVTGAWRELLSHADYPPGARALLGESVAAASLFTSHVKVDGRLSIQLRANGPLRSLFAESTAGGTVRGIVRLEE